MKGKWIKIHGSMLTEKAYGTCSICHKKSEMEVESYYLALDVIGPDKCLNCGNEMEFYHRTFESKKIRNLKSGWRVMM